MALTISKQLPSGVQATYVNIGRFMVDHLNSTIMVCTSAYLNQASRAAKSTPLSDGNKAYVMKDTDFTTAMAAPALIPAIYAWLKTQPDFAGATNC